MDKSEKKRIRRELEECEAKRRALSKTRQIGEDISFWGCGILKIQIIFIPSFEKGVCWDFRKIDNTIKVYKSIIDPEARIIEPGYYEAVVLDDFVSKVVHAFQTIKLPMLCDMDDDMVTLDDTTYKLSIASGFDNIISVTWGSESPGEWKSVINVVSKILKKLGQAKVVKLET